MVSLLLFVAAAAQAGSVTLAPTMGVSTDIGVRPGLRIGFEPVPETALAIQVDSSQDGHWDAGLSLAGRYYLSPASLRGEGIFAVGRVVAGFSGHDEHLGPWTGLSMGFGVRPSSMWNIEAAFGPEWSLADSARWRTDLSIGVVLDADSRAGRSGRGSIWHRPRPIPGR